MNRQHLIALVVIVVAFAAFLPLYYLFSYGKNDALQQTINEGNATNDGSTYNAPFGYGGSFLESLIFGIVGMLLVLAVFYGFTLIARRRRRGDE